MDGEDPVTGRFPERNIRGDPEVVYPAHVRLQRRAAPNYDAELILEVFTHKMLPIPFASKDRL